MEKHLKQSAGLLGLAEAIAQKERQETPPLEKITDLSPEEIQKTVHDLRVHQIELEIQNEELRQTQEKLEAAKLRYFDLYDLAPTGYTVLSEDGLILEANFTAVNMLRQTRRLLINHNFNQFIFEKDQDIYYFHRQKHMETGERKICDLRMVQHDGTPFWVQLVISSLQQPDGLIEYRIMICDIADRKRAEEALQETQKQVLHSEKLSAIGKLSASIAHEFNNPLQGIMAVLKGLKKRAILEKEDKELLDEAISESDRIKKLIQNLQEFNKPSSGKKISTDLHKILDSLLLLNKSGLRSKGISIERNFTEGLPQILAVPDQIKQVFLNLLINAGDACQQRGGVITVSTWPEKDKVAVAIKDTGIGFNPENVVQIFQPFYSTKSEGNGTGLGLSVSYGIIQYHQGEIRVESQPGLGATFTVLLPIQDARERAT